MIRVVEVWAVIMCRGEKWTGRMVCAHGFDQPCLAFDAAWAPANIPLGQQVTLGLATREMDKAISGGARVILVERTPDRLEASSDRLLHDMGSR